MLLAITWLTGVVLARGAGHPTGVSFQGLSTGGGSGDDEVLAVTDDRGGGLRVAGRFASSATFGATNLAGAGSVAAFVAALDAEGGWRWAASIAASGQAWANSVVCDAEGSTYAGGFFQGNATVGSLTLTNADAGTMDAFLVKFDVQGTPVWAKRFGAARDDRIKAMAPGAEGTVLVSGHFEQTVDFGGHVLTSAGGTDIFLACVEAEGVVRWAVRAGGGSPDEVYALASDGQGAAAVAGTVAGVVQFGGWVVTNEVETQAFVARCDGAGEFGWVHVGGSAAKDRASGVGMDAEGRVTVAGFFGGPASFGGGQITNAGNYTFTAQFGASGAFRWLVAGGGQDAPAVLVSEEGDVTVAGSFLGTNAFGGQLLTSAGGYDLFVERLDASGQVLWARSAGGIQADYAQAIAPAGSHGYWVAGKCSLGAQFDSFSVTNARGFDACVGRLSPAPAILEQPLGVLTNRGADVVFRVGVVGREPLACQWYRDRTHAVPGATDLECVLTGVTQADSGVYSAVITNAYGAVTSAPAMLTLFGIRPPQIFVNGAAGTNFAFTNIESVLLSVAGTDAEADVYYTLDGSQPSFASPRYVGPVEVVRSGTIRAIAFDADLASAEAVPARLSLGLSPPSIHVEGRSGELLILTNLPSARVTLATVLASARIRYTTNDTAPALESPEYTGPFEVYSNAVVRALAYTDNLGAATSSPVQVMFQRSHGLTRLESPDGAVQLEPPGGQYVEGASVTLTATPDPGWRFMHWEGDVTGTNPTQQVLMDRDRAVKAVFGTPVSVVISGQGRVLVWPQRDLHPRGSAVRLTAIPASGSFFATWSGAVQGAGNPATFAVPDLAPVAVASFSPLPEGVFVLTVTPNGPGTFSVEPAERFYTNGQQVVLAALPEPGETFLKWSGDGASRSNVMVVTMDANRNLVANFSNAGFASLENPVLAGGNLMFQVLSDPGLVLSMEQATQGYPAPGWAQVRSLTNVTGYDAVTNAVGEEPGLRLFRLVHP